MQAGSLGPLDQGQKHVGFAWRGQLPGATERARMPGAVTCAGKGSGGGILRGPGAAAGENGKQLCLHTVQGRKQQEISPPSCF